MTWDRGLVTGDGELGDWRFAENSGGRVLSPTHPTSFFERRKMCKYFLILVTVVIAASSVLAREKTGTIGAEGVSFTFLKLDSQPKATGNFLESARENAQEKPRMIKQEKENSGLEENFMDITTIKRGRKSGGAKFIEIKNDGTIIERRY